ncbi:pheromone A receptor-domain-containing protein [Mycena rebaudengoi]|nr:pheromone A receptor-domain-containing protein [Mycena rebaudengoi]
MWASLACLNHFVNSLVWAGNTLNSAPAWCEISIRITMATSVGMPSSSFCINRCLYNIANIRTISVSKAEKRRSVVIDSLICGLFPIVYTALQYIVHGHRYNIFEDIGCYPDLYNPIPTYFISSIWPIIIGLISAVYCVLLPLLHPLLHRVRAVPLQQHPHHRLALLPAHGARDDRAVLHHAARALHHLPQRRRQDGPVLRTRVLRVLRLRGRGTQELPHRLLGALGPGVGADAARGGRRRRRGGGQGRSQSQSRRSASQSRWSSRSWSSRCSGTRRSLGKAGGLGYWPAFCIQCGPAQYFQ